MELRTLGEQDRYVILGELGRGGMAEVYLAIDTKLGGRAVAVKRPLVKLSVFKDLMDRFGQEIDTMALAVHPNIVMLTDHAADPSPYIVMEYVGGLSAEACVIGTKAIAGFGPLPPRIACDVAIGMLHGLAKLEELGVVHRDVKPANVIIGWGLEVKLMDFGIARLVQDQVADATGEPDDDGRLTKTGFIGSKDYASPEQRRNARKADHRSDLYSVGSTLYGLLTGDSTASLCNEPATSWRFSAVHEALRPLVFAATRYLPEDIEEQRASHPELSIDDVARPFAHASEMIEILLDARAQLPRDGEPEFRQWLAARRAESPHEAAIRKFRAGPDPEGDGASEDQRKLAAGYTMWYQKAEVVSPTPPPDLPEPEPVVIASPSPRRSPWLPRAAAGMFAAGMLALAGSEAWQRMKSPEPDAPRVVVSEGKTEAVPALASSHLPSPADPVPSEPVDAEPVPVVVPATPVTRPTLNTRPTPRPEPTVVAPLVTPAIIVPPIPETPPAPTGGTVRLTGDTTTGELVGTDGKVRGLTSVPPGSYTVRAAFPTKGTVNAAKVTVSEGATTTLSCSERLAVCSVR